MSTPLRFGTAVSAVALVSALAGCAAPTGKRTSLDLGSSNIGLATRAQAALASQDYATAVSFAEQAVAKSPNDHAVRALLGNAYFASGRFVSAEAAYRDSLALAPNQPQVILKLALVQIAQGKSGEARAVLESGAPALDVADYGLALALAGGAAEAVQVLGDSARQPGADARLRQNLALAHALAGDWTAARTVAAQDVPADVLESRIEQWMALASPRHVSDQVATLVGVTPAAVDPGQPTRLALNAGDKGERVAEAAPAAPAVAGAAPVAVAEAAPAAAEPLAPLAIAEAPAPIVTDIAPTITQVAAAEPAPAFVTPKRKAKPAARKLGASDTVRIPLRKASLPRGGNSTAVVQLGAYGSPERVAAAWNQVARRYTVLKDYAPMSARFNGPRGTFYRLSVKGFANVREAQALCVALKRSGGSCFVRSVAGDSPVRLAAR